MKAKATARKIIAVILALTLAFSLAVSAVAAANNPAATPVTGKFTITIVPGETTAVPGGDSSVGDADLKERYKAYAIFVGKLNENPAPDGGYDPGEAPNNPPMQNQLTDIVWGPGIKGIDAEDPANNDYTNVIELLGKLMKAEKALKEIDLDEDALNALKLNEEVYGKCGEDYAEDSTLGEMFKAVLNAAGYLDVDGNLKSDAELALAGLKIEGTAATVAKVLADLNGGSANNNAKLAREFAKIVDEYLNDDAGVVSKWDGDKKHWTIDVPAAGYYLIKDSYLEDGGSDPDTEDDDKGTDFMLGVFGYQTIKAKSKGVTSDKVILTDENEVKGSTADIGDDVPFRLKGTLPENLANYETYMYTFHDTLSEGLTLNADSVHVYAVAPDGTVYELTAGFAVGGGEAHDDGKKAGKTCSLDVTFEDLKKDIKGKKTTALGTPSSAAEEDITITFAWKLYVDYTARVNEDAKVVAPKADGTFADGVRNSNKANVEFSNDVDNEDGTDETPEDEVYVYVFELDLDKTDGTEANPNKDALKGAGFALTKEFPAASTTDNTLYKLVDGDNNEIYLTKTALKKLYGDESMTDDELHAAIYDLANGKTKAVKESNSDYTADSCNPAGDKHDYSDWHVDVTGVEYKPDTTEETAETGKTLYKVNDGKGNISWVDAETLLPELQDVNKDDDGEDIITALPTDSEGWGAINIILKDNSFVVMGDDGVPVTKPETKTGKMYRIQKGDNNESAQYVTEDKLLALLGTDEIPATGDGWKGVMGKTFSYNNDDGYSVYVETVYNITSKPVTEAKYAVFTKDVDETGKTTTYTIAGWVTKTAAEAAAAAEGAAWIWTDKLTSDGIAALGDTEKYPAGGEYYLAVMTVDTDKGEKLLIKGMGEGDYTLIEVKVPGGFEKMEDVSFTIEATVNADTADKIPDGALTKVTVKVEEAREDVKIANDNTSEEINITTAGISIDLANMPIGYLPGTGGSGTALFYIGGALLLALAVACLLILNRKPARK